MNDVVSEVAQFSRTQRSQPEEAAADELARLMSEYERVLLTFTHALAHDMDLALDCVQETYVRAYEGLCRGRLVNRQWLFTVAHNRAIDELRRRRRLCPEPEESVAAPGTGTSETNLIVQEAMENLTRQHREVLYLFAVAGFTTEEIAGLLGTTGPAIRQRLYRARHEFRRAYEGGHP